jgi:F-type H+-transporting ATPase subunit gamma
MPSTKEIRARIRSVSSTAQVTNAMQLIAASKMQRAQQMVRNGRDYAEKIQAVLSDLTSQGDPADDENENITPLLIQRPVNRALMLLVTPDRGLAGALVGNLNRIAGQYVKDSEVPVAAVTVGRKGARFVGRIGQKLKATFSVADRPRLDDTVSISRFIVGLYESGEVDRVVMVYAQFVNTVVQKPVVRQILPVEPPAQDPKTGSESASETGAGARTTEYIFEPDPATVLNTLVPRYVETQIYHSILEAIASEHSARMVAMRNATDNANELIDGLTLDLNKARQEQITGELLDIVGGVSAVED